VSVTVLGVKGNQVHLGIDVPTKVAVHREDVFQRIAKEAHNKSVFIANRQAFPPALRVTIDPT